MTQFLLENPAAIVMTGAVLSTLAFVVHSQTRGQRSLLAILAIAVATVALVGVERWVETPREQVAGAAYALGERMEANDRAALLELIDPSASLLRRQVSAMMPAIALEKARVTTTPEVILEGGNPERAIARFRALLDGELGSSGRRIAFFDRVELHFIRGADNRWLLTDYALPSGRRIPRDWAR